jgi:Tol biopolymer transport system component/DNA-binding winged helix-turn-helix (wHTH) protein
MSRQPASSRIRFGVFEVDLEARELRKRGIKIKLQDQPFQLLAVLLQRRGEMITREELQASLWNSDTFVDFDRAVNKAVNRIREALGDLAATPRFIETLPRRGYRFIAPIDDGQTGAGRQSHSGVTQRLVRSSLLPPPNTSFLPNHFALSPDGSRLAFVAADSYGKECLWMRDLSASGAQQLSGAEGARAPFWSPEGRRIGFFADGKLKTIDVAGGAVHILCDARVAMGGAWHSDDVIVFAGQVAGPLFRIAASGGACVAVTPIPRPESSQLHCWPVFLPGTDRFLYFANRAAPADALRHGLHLGSLSSAESRLISAEIDGNVGFARGHMFFVNSGALKAQPFDLDSFQITGPPIVIAPNEVEFWERAWFHCGFSVSGSGILIFQPCIDFAPELVWTDALGNENGRIRQRGYWRPAISPDGRQVAVASDEFHDGKWYICVHDVERGVTTRLTDSGNDWHPSWSPDGKRLIYDSLEGHTSRTYEMAADGSGRPQLLLEPESIIAHASPDGPIAFMRLEQGRVTLLVHTPQDGQTVALGLGVEPQFSPDGKWLAFSHPGGGGIAVRPFPDPGARIQISRGPAAQPRWSRDGNELFYIAPDKKLMAVTFDKSTGRPGPPRQLFQTRIVGVSLIGFQYDVAPDGRFLINSLPANSAPLTLLTGWTTLVDV